MNRRLPLRMQRVAKLSVVALVAVAAVAACGASGTDTACEKSVSVSGYIVDLSQGLDNRAESEYEQFRLDSLDVFDLVGVLAAGKVGVDDQTRAAAMVLQSQFASFSAALDDVAWDLSRASADENTVAMWRDLITAQSLANANLVEAWIISKCGLPSRVTSNGDGPQRLPDPSIPSPTATDPPTGPVNDESEQQALGTVVATLFSLTLSPAQTSCLGRELAGVGQEGAGAGDPSPSRSEYQAAFDSCGIAFTVPAE